jgi:hypothetical protein
MASLRLTHIGLICLLLSFNGCKEENEPIPEIEKLPAATHTGAQTFGCLVDGNAWVVQGDVGITAVYQEGILNIIAREENKDVDRLISMTVLHDNLEPRTYEITIFPVGRVILQEFLKDCLYEPTSEMRGTLTVTHFDSAESIIAGTFEFEAYSFDCSETVKVSDGRFDLKYEP